MSQEIPKRIIQIYCPPAGRGSTLPLFNRCALQNLKLLHPDFEFWMFDQRGMEDFVQKEFPEFRTVMNDFLRPIQKFDFFRYLALYRLGGFYFDLDVFLARSLHPLLQAECVFPFEELTISDFLRRQYQFDWELANYGFGAVPNSKFIEKIIENCVRGLKDKRWASQLMRGIPKPFQESFFVPMTTGPGMVSRTFAENANLHRTVTILFPDNVCDEAGWQRFGDFGVHLMQASWRKRTGFLRRYLARLWEQRKRKKIMVESLVIGPVRSGEWISWFPNTGSSTQEAEGAMEGKKALVVNLDCAMPE